VQGSDGGRGWGPVGVPHHQLGQRVLAHLRGLRRSARRLGCAQLERQRRLERGCGCHALRPRERRTATAAAAHPLPHLEVGFQQPPYSVSSALVESSTLVRKGYDRNCLHHDLEVRTNPVPPPSTCNSQGISIRSLESNTGWFEAGGTR
jgi:hypothetical protein